MRKVEMKKAYFQVLDILPEIEIAIIESKKPKDRDFRNRSVRRLAQLDQGLARIRDLLEAHDHNNSNESEGYDEKDQGHRS